MKPCDLQESVNFMKTFHIALAGSEKMIQRKLLSPEKYRLHRIKKKHQKKTGGGGKKRKIKY